MNDLLDGCLLVTSTATGANDPRFLAVGPPRVSRNQDPRGFLSGGAAPPRVSRNQDPRSFWAEGSLGRSESSAARRRSSQAQLHSSADRRDQYCPGSSARLASAS